MWTCPDCGAPFADAECIALLCSVDARPAFRGGAAAGSRAAFERLVELATADGPIPVVAQKTRIVVAAPMRYLAVTGPPRPPRRPRAARACHRHPVVNEIRRRTRTRAASSSIGSRSVTLASSTTAFAAMSAEAASARRPPRPPREPEALERWSSCTRVVGPIATNVYVLADERSREAIAIDTATRRSRWIAEELAARDWTLKLIVSTPRPLGPHRRQRRGRRAHRRGRSPSTRSTASGSTNPQPLWAPFEIPPSVPAVELAEGGEIRFGELRLRVLHTPGHTEGSVCLLTPRRRPAVQRRHAVRRRVGAGGPARRRPRRRWSASLGPADRARRPAAASCRGTARRRRSGASEPGWSSSATQRRLFA